MSQKAICGGQFVDIDFVSTRFNVDDDKLSLIVRL